MQKKMTDKGFLHRSSGRISAAAFLTAHREYLTTGSLADFTSPILDRLDTGNIVPTLALNELRAAVLEHLLSQHAKAIVKESTPTKPYTASIFDGKGNIITDNGKMLVKTFNQSTEAEYWCDRRLYDGAQSWYGTICHVSGKTLQVDRLDSIARILKNSRGPVMRQNKAGSGNWKMRAKNDHFHFSRG